VTTNYEKKLLGSEFKKAIAILEPDWGEETHTQLAEMFGKAIQNLDEGQLSAASSSLGRLFLSVQTYARGPERPDGLHLSRRSL
jgi:hypothetical protein